MKRVYMDARERRKASPHFEIIVNAISMRVKLRVKEASMITRMNEIRVKRCTKMHVKGVELHLSLMSCVIT
jgi:hypothetical protein